MRKTSLILGIALALLGCEDLPPKPTGATASASPGATARSAGGAASGEAADADRPSAGDLPSDLGKVAVPADNAQSDAKIKLGHQLFFDKRLSADGSRSCYSCHQNEDGNGGKDPLAIGAKEVKLTRHSPVIWNVAFLSELYWDGRSKSLEEQGMAAWAGGNMGVGKDGLDAKAKEIAAIEGYKKAFDEVFPGEGVTPDNIVKAISAYERTLVCDDTAYDKFAKGDKKAMSEQQQKGLDIFMGKGACMACHAPPHFSTAYGGPQGTFFNVGIGLKDVKEQDADVGRGKVSDAEADWAAFKVPTLRNIGKSAPYFHDGSVDNLEDAVKIMSSGGHDNKNKSALVVDRKLSDDELAALVSFLRALDCNASLEEPTLP